MRELDHLPASPRSHGFPVEPPAEIEAPDETALRQARDADWRFLLPVYPVERVALLGQTAPRLIRGARRLARQAVLMPSIGQGGQPWEKESCDLVMCADGLKVEHLREAHVLLKPGGWVYWEIERARPGAGFALRRRLAGLRAHGFDSVNVYWHRPDFNNCVEIIPLRPNTLEFVFSRATNGWGRKAAFAAGWFLSRHNLLVPLIRCLSISARKPPAHLPVV